MAGELDAERLAAKQWRLRNSDGNFSFGDEYGRNAQVQSPPAFDLVESDLPPDTVRLSNPEDTLAEGTGDYAHALRHVHVFDQDLVEPA